MESGKSTTLHFLLPTSPSIHAIVTIVTHIKSGILEGQTGVMLRFSPFSSILSTLFPFHTTFLHYHLFIFTALLTNMCLLMRSTLTHTYIACLLMHSTLTHAYIARLLMHSVLTHSQYEVRLLITYAQPYCTVYKDSMDTLIRQLVFNRRYSSTSLTLSNLARQYKSNLHSSRLIFDL